MLTPEQIPSILGDTFLPPNFKVEKIQLACDLANNKHPQEGGNMIAHLRLLYAAHILMVFMASDLAIAKLSEEILKNGVIPSFLQSQFEESLMTTPYGQMYRSVLKTSQFSIAMENNIPILGVSI